MPSDPNAKWRVRIAFFFLFVSVIGFSVAAYFVLDLRKVQERMAARESRTALQGVTDARQVDEALRQHPQNKFLQLIAMATKAADETNAAIEKLSNEIAPPGVAKNINFGAASRSDLEALRRDLKTAQANATTFLPRYVALLEAERGKVDKYALSLHVEKDTLGKFMESIDKRQAEITAFASKMLSARADFYGAYDNYVAVLAAEYGAYKIENGQFIFPFQRTVDRYNVAAHDMTLAAKHVAELEQERKNLLKSQQERWTQFVSGK